MKKIIRIYRLKRKKLLIAIALLIPVIFVSVLLYRLLNDFTGSFSDPGTGLIVIDPGHGGIDGGSGESGFLEKEINLSVSLRLKKALRERGFEVIMTREKDESLEGLSPASGSRHQRDLSARASIINGSEAQLFLSIHVNSSVSNPRANGSIVYYGTRFEQSEALARCIQNSLNSLQPDSMSRDRHSPQRGRYFILEASRIPGVLIETAFITNYNERLLLATDEFRDSIAASIADGVQRYYEELHLSK